MLGKYVWSGIVRIYFVDWWWCRPKFINEEYFLVRKFELLFAEAPAASEAWAQACMFTCVVAFWHGWTFLYAENISWKRPVKGIREMCDSCSTTLFNMHWTCTKCGHAVCLDCYNALLQCKHSADDAQCKSCQQIAQRCCVRRRRHNAADLMPTQIIPTDGLLHFLLIWQCCLITYYYY